MGGTPLTIEFLDDVQHEMADDLRRRARRLGCRYADLRLEVSESQFAWAENGACKQSGREDALALGVRVIAGDGITAPGYAGLTLGAGDRDRLGAVVRSALGHAHARAMANARGKAAVLAAFPGIAAAVADTALAPVPVIEDRVPAVYAVDPRSVPLGEIVDLVTEVGAALRPMPFIAYTSLGALTQMSREIFLSTEGARIDQTFALTQGNCYIVAEHGAVSQELFDAIGHLRGWETLTHGAEDRVEGGSLAFPSFRAFASTLAEDAMALTRARPAPTTEGEVPIVLDPHFTALLVHEIVGHPTELDRALKMETGYAGRSWLLRSLDESQLGKAIASPLLSAYSDPSLPGLGHYRYDDEGVPGRRVVHIDQGIFRGFMNSRQTAAIRGDEPNGHAKATESCLVPLIRMSNTVFAAGTTDPRRLIEEVDRGYYLVGGKTPSIAESRENFRISAMKVYEIRRGKLGRLLRDGGIMADSRAFLTQVDGVGSDFRLFGIPNCGKGQPMQTKRVGNGGPTLRSRAVLTGGA